MEQITPKLMTKRSELLALLRVAVNDQDAEFRDGQWEAIDALVNRRERLLVVERTGWGKSAVYFIATRVLRNRGRGLTLIVSPLLALMRNPDRSCRAYWYPGGNHQFCKYRELASFAADHPQR